MSAPLLDRLRSPTRHTREQAFAELYEAHHRPLLNLCLRVTGHPQDAEDALQEAFADAARGLASFREESLLSTWLYRIAIRAALRISARRPRPEQPLELPPPAPSSPDPADQRERLQRILGALRGLSPEHRSVLALSAIDELSTRQVAAVLGIPEGTVHSRLHHAKARLKERLGIG